jgi:hypothetical protein
MHDRDPRAEELDNLKVALATFALQLDAFEDCIKVRPAKPHIEMAKLFSVDVAKITTKRDEKYPPRLSDSSS